MAIVVGSPYPADEFGSLEPLIKGALFALQTHLAVTVLLFWNSSTVLYLLLRYFGTLYNLTATLFMFFPATDNTYDVVSIENVLLNSKHTVILQLRLYALYGCSKRLLVLMVTLFAAESIFTLRVTTTTT
ncbi:hypothetical protein SCLCIDRAFT_1138992 [Scleroderma citrinum Foug A]|uniref:Uncharacterized protein n=1 Tax=Scleroderma citrinum Foug A TaxID=1036808 RepID=A0A0C3D998_9AGAM|nr:hypothetical protein SCLCIDRAFT_1138992 [Scleroderma citrinum Foug A]